MQVHVYERIVLGFTFFFLIGALAAIGGSIFGSHIHLPGPVLRLDPRTVRQTAPFDQPGLQEVRPGQYLAVMTAATWAFSPAEIRVPRGASVTFQIASIDVTHGFLIENTNVNLTLIPGHVAEASTTFREPGSYLIICHEYCGISHQAMYARVVVQ